MEAAAGPTSRQLAGTSARLIAYFPLADAAIPVDLLDLYAEAGVDVVEFGWPARAPYHDGPDVRASMARAARGDPHAAFVAARRRLASHRKAPKALIMSYAEEGHPALIDPAFYRDVAAALVVGPADDALRHEIEARAMNAGAALSTFVTLPITSADIAAARRASEYVMLQAAAGVTGPRESLDPDNCSRIAALRAGGVEAPIVLGFGVSNGEQARAAIDFGADGVVVGSAVLRAALNGRAEVAALLRQLREGLDG
jgi:tryptophan synthase alpha chain